MKHSILFFFTIAFFLCANLTKAQDVTSTYLSNPSFEAGDLSGWTITGADGYAWIGPNTDGDGTKHGTYVAGVWNSTIGDVEFSQSITNLPNGFYKVGCLMTVTNRVRLRLSSQRLFVNNKSVLYAAEEEYPVQNMTTLSATEDVAFAGHLTSGVENGPFNPMSIIVEVSDGILKAGIRTNGAATQYDFDFRDLGTDIGFFKFDNLSLTNVSSLLIQTLSIDGVEVSGIDASNVQLYTKVLPAGTTSVPTVTATANAGAKVEIIPAASLPGSSEIIIRAEDESYSLSYFVRFEIEKADPTLRSLNANKGIFEPDFDPSIQDYTLLVPFGTTMVDFDAVPNNPAATVVYLDGFGELPSNGVVPVGDGGKDIEISVTAADGATSLSYYVAINLDGDEKSAYLGNIALSEGTLYPAFDRDITEYKVFLPIGVSSVTPTATPLSDKATVSGDEVVSLTNGHGRSAIGVISGDGNATKTYTVTYDWEYLTNPSFETADLTGWTLTGADGYAWTTPNTDVDGSQDGSYITGVWNGTIGDLEWLQSISGLPNGHYKVGCLMTVSHRLRLRLSTQRLFANEKSVLYAGKAVYSAENLNILEQSEELSFAGMATSDNENGPLLPLDVIVEVTDGNLNLGTRVNGSASLYEFDFQGLGTDIGFYKFDKFSVSNVSSLLINTLTIDGATVEGIDPSNIQVYDMVLPKETTTIPTVSATSIDANAKVKIIPAEAFPGSTEIVFTAADSSFSLSYFVNFVVPPPVELASITLSEGKLYPEFSSKQKEYHTVLPIGTTTVDVNATGIEADSKITGDGAVDVSAGSGSITITVTSADDVRTQDYTIHYIVDSELTLKHSYNFDDGTARDVEGGAHGVINGGVVSNGVFTSSESGDFITLPADEIALNKFSAITLEAYVTNGSNPSFAMLAYFGGLTGANSYFMQLTRGGDNEFTNTSRTQVSVGTAAFASGPRPIDDMNQHFVSVLTYDSIYWYVDGLLEGKVETPRSVYIAGISTENAWLCKSGWNDPTWLGSIHEFNIYEGEMDINTVAMRSINFPAPGDASDATLSELTVDAVELEGFAPYKLTYVIELPEGTTTVPVIDAAATNPNANIVITPATTIPGITTIVVTSQDGIFENTYKFQFTDGTSTSVEVVKQSSTVVFPTVSSGNFTIKTEAQASTITIFDLSGRVINRIESVSSETNISIDKSGMYILQVESQGKVEMFKVIKRN